MRTPRTAPEPGQDALVTMLLECYARFIELYRQASPAQRAAFKAKRVRLPDDA